MPTRKRAGSAPEAPDAGRATPPPRRALSRLLVKKFGGTSVGDVARINAVADQVAQALAAGERVVVVVSAMAGETDRLEGLGFDIAAEPPPRELDMLLAAGEQASMALVAMALIERGWPARSWLGSQVPILTDPSHTRARIERVETAGLLADVDAGVTPVVAGFQGVSAGGEITTFGRGGSDTTAVAVAAALSADECQIYTDVDGVHTADPRIVKDAKLLETLTFEEMLELSSLGAKVLHSRSVELVGKYDVPLRVLSSFPNASSGTLITKAGRAMEQPLVSGLTYTRDAAKLTLIGVPDQPGIASRVLGSVGQAHIEVDMIVQNIAADGRADVTFTVRRADFARAQALVAEVAKGMKADVAGDDTIAKVSAVGVGMRSHAGVATRMFEALANEDINIQMISTSEIKISVVVAERHLETATRCIHRAFGLGDPPTEEE